MRVPDSPMRAWLITIGEPLPSDPGPPRLLRAGILASMMQTRGVEVTWWTSAFDHQRKAMREGQAAIAPQGHRMELLRGEPYASSVSFARIRNHRQTAEDFVRRADGVAPPDVVLCSYPTIELCEAAAAYGRRHRVPVVLDIRDLWPDIFLELAPRMLRGAARIALEGMFRASRRACADATAIIGTSEGFVNWGTRRAGRARRSWDRPFPLAYEMETPAAAALESARRYWDDAGIVPGGATLCFFGTLSRQFDIPTVIEAARGLRDRSIRFVLCGTGDRLEEYRASARDVPNVMFPGWVDAAAIRVLMERSLAGLAPYRAQWSFTMTLPNKPIEYLAGGLPVISSLPGELAALLQREDCGLTYAEGDPRALAGAIDRVVSDRSMRKRLASNARRAHEREFVAEKVYARLIDYLREIVRGNVFGRIATTA